ncbi:MAG: transposase [Alphaproteobacteria bacterium]
MKPDSTLTRQNGGVENGVNDSSSAPENSSSARIGGLEVEWSEDHGRLSQMGGLSYFAGYLEATGLFEDLVRTCPLVYLSNNAPSKRDVLGEIVLSVLSGQTRYAHMASLANAQLDAQTLGMEKIPSEDSTRSALKKLVGMDGAVDKLETQRWMRGCFDQLQSGCLEVPWVLDIDVTVKPIYGKQEGAVLGYNPAKPGRPSHAYHSFWVGHLRLCLGVQVRPGNETAGSFGLPLLREWLERTPQTQWPEFVRGDIGYGTQTWMLELERLGVIYLFKIKQTAKVKELIGMCELQAQWESSPGNWQYCESQLQLTGWDCARRVVVYRRVHVSKQKALKEPKTLTAGTCEQGELLDLEVLEDGGVSYEYAIYVTNSEKPASEVRPMYNPRGDNENCYDEMKNQWGWGGFTLADLPRSELMAQLIALIYNWWSIYIKLVDPLVAREAITSRPMYLMHPAKAHTHQSKRKLVIFCAHSQAGDIRRNLNLAAQRLKLWASLTAEQLKLASVWKRIIAHILEHHRTIGAGKTRAPPALPAAN